MIRLILIAALAFAFAWLLCWGAMKFAQAIVQAEASQIERITD